MMSLGHPANTADRQHLSLSAAELARRLLVTFLEHWKQVEASSRAAGRSVLER